MAMTSMKMSADEAKEYPGTEISSDAPEYPYGLCLRIGNDEIEKLKLTEIPDVGTEVMIMAKAFVKSTSAYDTQSDGKTRSAELQITDMELAPAKKDAASVMYPGA